MGFISIYTTRCHYFLLLLPAAAAFDTDFIAVPFLVLHGRMHININTYAIAGEKTNNNVMWLFILLRIRNIIRGLSSPRRRVE